MARKKEEPVLKPKKAPAKPKSNAGRPTKYNEETVSKVLDLIATHPYGLKRICDENDDIPEQTTLNMWRWKHPEFSLRYQVAKQQQAELIFEDCAQIALERETYIDMQGNVRIDAGAVARHKHITDVAKWTVSKLAPQKYGDMKNVEELKADQEDIKAELRAQRAILDKASKKPY